MSVLSPCSGVTCTVGTAGAPLHCTGQPLPINPPFYNYSSGGVSLVLSVYMMEVYFWCRHGADRSIRDNDELTPVDHAEVRGHTECAHILHNYGLRRPSSALSVASQVPLVLCVHKDITSHDVYAGISADCTPSLPG